MYFQDELFLLRLPMTRRSKSLKYVRCKSVPRTYFWENNKYWIFDVRMVLKMWNVTFLSLTMGVLKIFRSVYIHLLFFFSVKYIFLITSGQVALVVQCVKLVIPIQYNKKKINLFFFLTKLCIRLYLCTCDLGHSLETSQLQKCTNAK